jgi:uncharacterized protein YndB with AHSA1/START domain
MANKSDAAGTQLKREIVLTRVFDAPRSLVFKAWTDVKQLARWWGPHGFTNPVCEIDVRPGGALRIVMRGPDGVDYPMKGVFREVVEPERLVFTNIVVDHDGKHLAEGLTTVTFAEHEGKTKLTLQTGMVVLVAQAAPMLEGMEAGWTQSLERLAELVTKAAERELTLTRIFDAPRSLVFKCWTEPKHLEHWQGAPRGFVVTTHEMDIRPGGAFRLCMRSPEGTDHWLQGNYLAIVEPERLVFTHTWLDAEGKPGQETLVTITFTEREEKTELLLVQTGFKSVESRNGHKDGWTSTLDCLAEYLARA